MQVKKYCRMHSTILLTFIKLPIVTKTFVLSILSGRFTLVLLVLFCLLGVMLVCLLEALVMPLNSSKARGSVYTYAYIYSAAIFIEPLTHITVICIRHSIC